MIPCVDRLVRSLGTNTQNNCVLPQGEVDHLRYRSGCEPIEFMDTDAHACPISVVHAAAHELLSGRRLSSGHCIWKYNFASVDTVELSGLE